MHCVEYLEELIHNKTIFLFLLPSLLGTALQKNPPILPKYLEEPPFTHINSSEPYSPSLYTDLLSSQIWRGLCLLSEVLENSEFAIRRFEEGVGVIACLGNCSCCISVLQYWESAGELQEIWFDK